MSSRRILWALLAFAALPALLEATGGCGFMHGSLGDPEPLIHNAVECSCKFDGAGTRTLRVQASSDDAEQDGVTMDLTNGDLDLADKHVGLRFARIGLPANATIQSAYVQFTADETQDSDTTVTIQAQGAVDAPTFTTGDANVTLRTPGSAQPITWEIPDWTNNDAESAQRTPELKTLLQELVDLPNWNETSPVVLRMSGSGHRTAESFDGDATHAPELVVSYAANITADVAICAPAAPYDAGTGQLTNPAAECNRLATAFGGLNQACGYPAGPTCTVVQRTNPNGGDPVSSFQKASCEEFCAPNEVDAPECTEYDPVAFASCVAGGTPVEHCADEFASATHADPGFPVCVASGSPLAFHAFGRRSLCEVAGTSELTIGDLETKFPQTEGSIELVSDCPGGNCSIHPFFLLNMDPVTFEVRWATDPTFGNLAAAGSGLESALLDGGLSTFASDTIEGTATGRRGSDGLAVNAMNPDPLKIGVDWFGRTCNMHGTLAIGVGDDGVCEADGTIPCSSDADCSGVGGVCLLPPDDDAEMSVIVALGGELVNQPPTADAGPDQTIECISTAGSSFTLNGRGSSDPEPNLALASWREGSRTGPEISNDLVAVQSLSVGGSQSYVLRVIDTLAQLDEDITTVSVVDTTPPVIACNAPATIKPPNALISFAATATDVCDADVAATVTGYDCFGFTKKGRRMSRDDCIVSFTGGTVSIADVGGYGDHITWTVEAVDDSGTVGTATCEVLVAK